MKNMSLLEGMCLCLLVTVSSVVKADGQVNRSAPCGFALTANFAHSSLSIHTAASLAFFLVRE